MDIGYLALLALLVFGFGFVIFWHELGHFLAAKWAGVEVEQFAVGFGQALVSWRKGLGYRMGTSRPEFEKRVREYLNTQEEALKNDPGYSSLSSERQRLDYAAAKLGLSPTEYRLNWIPLGGYVKMLGQDDLDPNAKSDSPDSYNNKPIGKRMVIVSAGVIMNVILAIVFFTVLFRMGFDVPPTVVGGVEALSPAAQAGMKVGDRVVSIDGTIQHDFNKIATHVALLEEGKPAEVVVRGPDGNERKLSVTPVRDTLRGGFLRLGIEPSAILRGIDVEMSEGLDEARDLTLPDAFTIRPGDAIAAINGKPVEDPNDYYLLDRAIQESKGQPVMLTVLGVDGQTREESVRPRFDMPFGNNEANFLGLIPRATVFGIIPGSSAIGKLKPGDVILSMTVHPGNDPIDHPTPRMLRETLLAVSKSGGTVDLTVQRDGQQLPPITGLEVQTKLEQSRTRGLGIAHGYDGEHAVVGAVNPDSAASRAGIPGGATIVSINGTPVQSWYDVHRALGDVTEPKPVAVVARTQAGEKTYELTPDAADLQQLASVHYSHSLMLAGYREPRYTTNPIEAATWGLAETRDLILQSYVTLQRIVDRSIDPANMMGPLGIFHQGSIIADRGADWVIWFLAMISANLAVVNFLPIPIVDGGLFLFLVLEKIMGRPLSPKVQGIVQLVGLALIVGVFLFVTYHDLTRLFY